MIIVLTKTMYTKILGQPPIRSKGQYKRAEGFTYSFVFNIKRRLNDWTSNWNIIEKIAVDCLIECVGVGVGVGGSSEERKLDAKDVELSVDIASGNYTVRFSSNKDLPEEAYAFELLWLVNDADGIIPLQEYPYDYVKRTKKITFEINPIPLDDIEEE